MQEDLIALERDIKVATLLLKNHVSRLQVLILTNLPVEIVDYKAISMREVTKYCKEIRGNYPKEKRELISKIVTFLKDAFPQQTKFLKKTNAVMVFIMADIALENGITPEEFREFVLYFAEHVPFEYEENTGAGNIKRTKTEGRLKAMQESMEMYFKLRDKKSISMKEPVTTKGTQGVRLPQADKTKPPKLLPTQKPRRRKRNRE